MKHHTLLANCDPVIDHFNGKTMLLKQIWISANKLHLYTDAGGSLGFGAIF
jgi:hypothetical protein